MSSQCMGSSDANVAAGIMSALILLSPFPLFRLGTHARGFRPRNPSGPLPAPDRGTGEAAKLNLHWGLCAIPFSGEGSSTFRTSEIEVWHGASMIPLITSHCTIMEWGLYGNLLSVGGR